MPIICSIIYNSFQFISTTSKYFLNKKKTI